MALGHPIEADQAVGMCAAKFLGLIVGAEIDLQVLPVLAAILRAILPTLHGHDRAARPTLVRTVEVAQASQPFLDNLVDGLTYTGVVIALESEDFRRMV